MNAQRSQCQLFTIRELITGKHVCSQALSEKKNQLREISNEAESALLQNERTTISGKALLEKRHQTREKPHRHSKERSIRKDPIIPEAELLEKYPQTKEKSRRLALSKRSLTPKNPIIPEQVIKQHQIDKEIVASSSRESRSKSLPNSEESLAMKLPIREQRNRSAPKNASPKRTKREHQKQRESRKVDGVPTPLTDAVQLDRLHRKQQRNAFEKMKAWARRCSSLEDDDMFTMFRWSINVLDDEEVIEKHRKEYEKTQRRDSIKERMIITPRDIFGRSLEEHKSFSNTDTITSNKKQRPESLVRQFLRRASSTFGNSSKKN